MSRFIFFYFYVKNRYYIEMNLKFFLNKNNIKEKEYYYFRDSVLSQDAHYVAHEDFLKDFETWRELKKAIEKKDHVLFSKIYDREFEKKYKYRSKKSREPILKSINESLFILACLNQENLPIVKFLIESQNVNPNIQEGIAIILVSQFGFDQLVSYLIDKGADATIQDDKALVEAAGEGHLKVLDVLFKKCHNLTRFDLALKQAKERRQVNSEYVLRLIIEKKQIA